MAPSGRGTEKLHCPCTTDVISRALIGERSNWVLLLSLSFMYGNHERFSSTIVTVRHQLCFGRWGLWSLLLFIEDSRVNIFYYLNVSINQSKYNYLISSQKLFWNRAVHIPHCPSCEHDTY